MSSRRATVGLSMNSMNSSNLARYDSRSHTKEATMAQTQNPPMISLAERDCRYAAVRERLRGRGVDCVVVSGTNLFYLSNGLPGERTGLLPTADLPIMVAINSRHLADIPASVVEESQDWVKDVRPGNDAAPVIDRVKELKLDKATIGIVESDTGHSFYTQL